ncbi:MAG: zinc metallopeptidase [Bacillota bacterium]
MGYGFYYDPSFIILIPAMIFAFYAQSRISSVFGKYLTVGSRFGYTGYEVARRLLDAHGLHDVNIEQIQGRLTDHYDPRHKVLRLSNEVYAGRSIASVGVAAHECGHAIQHMDAYAPLSIRNAIAPIASIGSQAAFAFIIGGLVFNALNLLDIGILLFSGAVIFQIITLPVEFNASSRAVALLESNDLVPTEELGPVRKVLNAAALTYVAATVMAILQLARLLLLRGRRN